MGNTGRDFREFAQEPISLCVCYHLFFVAWLISGNQVSHWNRYIINAGAALEISWTPIRKRSVLLYRLLVVIRGGRVFIIYFITHITRINLSIHLSFLFSGLARFRCQHSSAVFPLFGIWFSVFRRKTCGFPDLTSYSVFPFVGPDEN